MALLLCALGLAAEEKRPPLPSSSFDIFPASGKIRIDGVIDISTVTTLKALLATRDARLTSIQPSGDASSTST